MPNHSAKAPRGGHRIGATCARSSTSSRKSRGPLEHVHAVRELLDHVPLVLVDHELAAHAPAHELAVDRLRLAHRHPRVVAPVLDEERRLDRVQPAPRRQALEQLGIAQRPVLALAGGAAPVLDVFSRKVRRFEMPTNSIPAAQSSGWNASAASTM